MFYNLKLITLVTVLAIFGIAIATAEKWDMPMAYSATNFHSEVGAEFAQCVTNGTESELEIVTHPSGSLFKGNEIKRAVQTGQVNIGERLLSAHQNENPLYGVDSIPFLVSSFEEHEKLWEIAGPKIAEVLAEDNLHYLYSVPWPPQGFYFNKAVNSITDMDSLKFRSYNTATARLAELTGMIPTQVEEAEVAQAFATGVAQSMISSAATGYDRKLWEHLSHFYEIDAWLPRNAVFVNSDVWNRLNSETQNVFNDCATQAKTEGLARSKDYTKTTLEGLRNGGMKVLHAGDSFIEELKNIGETMTKEWLDASGSAGLEIINSYQNQ